MLDVVYIQREILAEDEKFLYTRSAKDSVIIV